MRMLITGTSRGIGRYLAEAYVSAGHTVIGISRQESDFSSHLYSHYCGDVTVEKDIKKIFSDIGKKHGGLDALINNAGAASMNHFLLTPTQTAERLMRTNYISVFTMCREAARLMTKGKSGRIINFSTVAVPMNLEGEAAYAASKSAVCTLTQVLAKELAPFGITVNAVGPAPIRTDLIRGVPEEKLQLLIEKQAIKRFGEMEDVLNVCDFFISEKSGFITAQIVYLGGVC